MFEAMLEGWKHDARNVWWVVDYNRQSLASVVAERLFGRARQLLQGDTERINVHPVLNLAKPCTRAEVIISRHGGRQ